MRIQVVFLLQFIYCYTRSALPSFERQRGQLGCECWRCVLHVDVDSDEVICYLFNVRDGNGDMRNGEAC